MKNLKQLLSHIQNKPYETKVRILWTSTLIAAVLLVFLWLIDLKSAVSNLDNQKSQPSVQQTTARYIAVERAEVLNGNTRLFFMVNNETDDILNFSTIDDIRLDLNQSGVKPAKLLSRQDKPFVQKILSHTQQFGILTFTGNLEDVGEITFDQLYFEKHPETILKEAYEVDFDQLKKAQELKN